MAALVAIGAVALAAVAALAILRDGPATATAGDGSDDDWGGVLLDEPLERPDFTLTDTEGRPFDFRTETQGKLTLLFFGYTSCPDVCPIQMQVLADALSRPGTPQPTVVFVTTDPARDTPEKVRSFLDRFDADFVGLTGTEEEIAAAEAAAAIPPSTREDGDDDGYDVFHASQVIAFTADDLAHVVYPQGVRQQAWTADLPRLVQEFPAP